MSQFANSAYFSTITAANTSKSFTHKMAAKASWHRNYVTVTLCIRRRGYPHFGLASEFRSFQSGVCKDPQVVNCLTTTNDFTVYNRSKK